MRMKTYQADSVQEALLQVKNELGPEAVILKTEKKVQNLLGRKKTIFEVTAALDEKLFVGPAPDGATPPGTPTYTRSKTLETSPAPQSREKISEAALPGAPTGGSRQIHYAKMMDDPYDLGSLRREIKTMIKGVGDIRDSLRHMDLDQVAPEFLDIYRGLVEKDFEEDLARELIRKLGQIISISKRVEPDFVQKVLGKVVANRLAVAEPMALKPGRPNIVMLVGPTGVGKTTTIAKLAGVYKFEQNLDVGILSTDSQRMGAMEQMQAFCTAAEIDLAAVYGPEDIKEGLKALSDKDIILIDTAGSVKSEPESWRSLQELVRGTQPDFIHLVLSSNVRTRDLKAACRNYQALGASQIIFTKLDESVCLGNLYNVLADGGLPVSFLCNGQDIPDNILKAKAEPLSRMLLEDLLKFETADMA